MTKEQALEQVETAHKIYELLKPIPVNERNRIWNFVEQFNQTDWNEFHKNQYPLGSEKCATGLARNY